MPVMAKMLQLNHLHYIAGNVVIGDGTWIGPNAVIMDGARIGKTAGYFRQLLYQESLRTLNSGVKIPPQRSVNNTTVREGCNS